MARTRDARGRFVKGVSGNPKGRPTDVSKVDFGDFLKFKNTMVKVDTLQGKRFLTREAAILERLLCLGHEGQRHGADFSHARSREIQRRSG